MNNVKYVNGESYVPFNKILMEKKKKHLLFFCQTIKKVIRKHVTFLSKTKAMVRLQWETFKSLSLSNKITLDFEEQKSVVGLWMVFRKVLMHVDTYKVSWQLLQCNSPFNMSLCLRIKHCLAGVSQLSQFDAGIFCTV